MDELKNKGFNYNSLEIARVLGEPLDPRKPYPNLVSAVCQTDTADPDEYVYYYDVLLETDKVHTITSTGQLTTVNVTADTPTAFTFIDLASPEYWVKITDLAKSKEATLARKLRTVDRALNMEESRYIISLAATAASTASNQNTLVSGAGSFNYRSMISMIEDVIDYGDNYALLVGSTIDKDIKLWDWTDNKNASMLDAFKNLGLEKIRVTGTFTLDTTSNTSILAATKAYLVARDTVVGNPFLFVRKNLNDIDLLGAAIKQNGERPQRLIFASPNPVSVDVSGTSTRYLAVGLTGYEEIVCACINPYAISEFSRT